MRTRMMSLVGLGPFDTEYLNVRTKVFHERRVDAKRAALQAREKPSSCTERERLESVQVE